MYLQSMGRPRSQSNQITQASWSRDTPNERKLSRALLTVTCHLSEIDSRQHRSALDSEYRTNSQVTGEQVLRRPRTTNMFRLSLRPSRLQCGHSKHCYQTVRHLQYGHNHRPTSLILRQDCQWLCPGKEPPLPTPPYCTDQEQHLEHLSHTRWQTLVRVPHPNPTWNGRCGVFKNHLELSQYILYSRYHTLSPGRL